MRDPQGKKLGTVSQKNEIAEGSLDGPWGKIADQAAGAAVQGIVKLLPQATKPPTKAMETAAFRPGSGGLLCAAEGRVGAVCQAWHRLLEAPRVNGALVRVGFRARGRCTTDERTIVSSVPYDSEVRSGRWD